MTNIIFGKQMLSNYQTKRLILICLLRTITRFLERKLKPNRFNKRPEFIHQPFSVSNFNLSLSNVKLSAVILKQIISKKAQIVPE